MCCWIHLETTLNTPVVTTLLHDMSTRRQQFHEPPRFPRGFRCASRHIGLKPSGKDLSLFVSDVDAAAAAVFTRNQFPGAPIVLGRETIAGERLRAIVVNSKVSNVATGDAGVTNARRMAAAAARELGSTADRVLVSSTGVIGVPLPIEKIELGMQGMAAELQTDPLVGAEGIMTTDSHPKALSASVGDATLTWVAKGSGMIEPNMATMLAYIFTDAAIDATALDRLLRAAVHVSFNMLSVDTDTSTSDTCVILANGLAGHVDASAFAAVLSAGCVRMAEMLARDGEGATRLLRVIVRGAANEPDARRVAKSLVNSPLIKTMVHGADPNVGRILMAVGKCTDVALAPAKTSATVNGFEVVRRGARVEFEDALVRTALSTSTVELIVELGVGLATATAFGCDLSRGYVDENAAYYSS
jgi:glutamate N-acetyltransferase/amino-acid N-acetyltransferase